MEIEPSRVFNSWNIILDIIFLIFLFVVLVYTKRYQAIIAGLLGGILYMIVDYGLFYLILGTRIVIGANPFWLLLWLSMSYGFTNFAWIWLWLDRDKRALEWSLLIMTGWFATALLGKAMGAGLPQITIARGTGDYHGFMALILFVGYAILCVHNIRVKNPRDKIDLPWILAIGILVQFAWEFVLLVSGIRPPNIMPIIVNSLLETNLGLPYLYFIHRHFSRR